MNPLDQAFLELSSAPVAGRATSPETAAPTRAPAPELPPETPLHHAEALVWPDLIEELVRLAAGRLHGVGEVLLQSSQRGDKRIALASCHPGEGRTTLALTLGRWFSDRHHGRKLLLVDADLGGADLSRRLGVSGGSGASDFLRSREEPYALDVGEGLSILGAGTGHERDQSLDEDAWDSLAGWLRPRFDLILVDTGAALSEGFSRCDAECLAEAVLWIRDPQRTSLSELCDAQRQIALASVGVIENFVPQHRATLHGGADRRRRVDSAGELHVHVNRLRGNGVAKHV